MSASQFEGLPVLFCTPGSPAERAGVLKGDRLLFLNGVRIDSVDAFMVARAKNQRGMSVTVLRGNTVHEMTFEFDVHDEAPAEVAQTHDLAAQQSSGRTIH